jgi:hypothetical protein
MQGWRTVVAYTADREKGQRAENPFQKMVCDEIHVGAAQVKQ